MGNSAVKALVLIFSDVNDNKGLFTFYSRVRQSEKEFRAIAISVHALNH
jgi:hypothetical protein